MKSFNMFRELLVIFLFVHCVFAAPVEEKGTNRTVCTTEECFEVAQYLSNAMDVTKNPCDNFYDFVCGNYVKEAIIPPGYGKIGTLVELGGELDEQLETLILENLGAAYTKATLLVTELYGTCIYSHGNIDIGIQAVETLLPALGGWPVLQDGDWSSLNWQNVSYTARALGINSDSFMPVQVQYDFFDTNKYSLLLYLPTFLIPQSSLQQGINNPLVQGYKYFIINLAQNLGATDLEYTEKEVEKLLNFEIQLAKIAVQSAEAFETIAAFELAFPNIPWETYLTHMLGIPNLQLNKEDTIAVESVSYVRDLNTLLQNTDSTVLASYLQFRAIENIVNLAGTSFANRIITPRKWGGIIQPRVERLEFPAVCLTVTRAQLPQALSSMYARKYMNPEIKNNLLNMISNFKEGFLSTIEDNGWFDDETKEYAQRKVIAMATHAAYADELFDDDLLDKYYESVDVDPNYAIFQLNINKFNMDNALGKYNKPVNKTSWDTRSSITDVNAYYAPLENSLQILAGILQNPVFRKENPNFVNFASIGSVIGHEINHGFDTSGSQFNEFGELFNWFTQESMEEYNRRVQCIYREYLAVNHNESISAFTINEDIADSGGLLLSYASYQKWVAENYAEGSLPGLDYTPNQLFWMFFSRLWCAKETDEYIEFVAPFDPHSRELYRGLVPLTNSPDFARDFNCPVGSFMNPESKCKVW